MLYLYWQADQLNGCESERAYGTWEGHRQGWHDQVELGERVAEALAAENGTATGD